MFLSILDLLVVEARRACAVVHGFRLWCLSNYVLYRFWLELRSEVRVEMSLGRPPRPRRRRSPAAAAEQQHDDAPQSQQWPGSKLHPQAVQSAEGETAVEHP